MTTDDHTPATGHADQRKQDDQNTDHGPDQPGDGHDWNTYDGPVWSAAEAARRCGIPRSTLTRRLAAGTIPGATRDADGWHIPALGLALAGIATMPPADDTPTTGADDHQDTGDADAAASAQVAILTARLETERARREGAERLAEERADRIRDLQTALRALAPPPADDDSDDGDQDATDADRPDARARSASSPGHGTPTATPTPQTAAQTGPQPRRGLFARLRDALTAD
jgi:hypothetical protein